MATVGIGPNFFKKSFNDYRNWQWAYVREAMQNSMDAPHSKNIGVSIELIDGNTVFTWWNDGKPMNREELEGKLLTLGESGKDFKGTIGGFGKAKELLLMANISYEIRTGDLRVVGSGGNYDCRVHETYDGTYTRVVIEGDHVNTLMAQLKRFLSMSQWHGQATINGEVYEDRMLKGSRRREFEWAVVYTNKKFSDTMIVRINGIPMFSRWLNANGRCVVVELNFGGSNILQSNRDSLRSDYQVQLESFTDDLVVNKTSALRELKPVYFHYAGDKLYNIATKQAAETMQAIISEAYATIPTGDIAEDQQSSNSLASKEVGYSQQISTHYTGSRSKLKHEFIVKNNAHMQIPMHYLPSNFSDYSLKLATIWTKLMLSLHELFNKQREFSVGFIFDPDVEAEYERGEYGDVYFISPTSIIKQDSSNSRSMAKRWKFNPSGRWALLSRALHEFVHGAAGMSGHGEDYSSTLTDLTGVVLKERQRFNKCFV